MLVITLGLIIHFSFICSFAGDKTISLQDAFDAGYVSLTFTAKAPGKMLQVGVKKVSPVSIIAEVDKGNTTFVFGPDKWPIYTDSIIIVDLTDKEEASFIVQKTGSGGLISGSITYKNTKAK